MSVHDLDVVDSISLDDQTGRVMLGIEFDGRVTASPDVARALVEKINRYVSFIRDGGLERAAPQAVGFDPWIEVTHLGALDERAKAMIAIVSEQLSPVGVSIRTVDVGKA